MKILYASNICSNKEFKKIFNMCSIKPLQSIQKFNKLMCEGLAKNDNIDLEIVTSAPVNIKMCKKIFWKGHREIENEIIYNYCFMINFPIIKFITLFISSLIKSINWCLKNIKNKDRVVIYDAYCPIIANTCAIIGKIFGCKVIGLYTDVPICMDANLENKNKIKNILKKIYNLIDSFSNSLSYGFIILTEKMNEVINKKNKPFLVVEGFCDEGLKDKINSLEDKYAQFTILYAGGLYKKFGICNLIQAIEESDKDIKLLLFGDGELTNILKNKYNDKEGKVFYGGVLPNEQIVIEEMKATLLINPRFSNELYTKYSFPSKNMEYMASGTPLLTTRLKGMTTEYEDKVYFIKIETAEGIKQEIEALFETDRKILHSKGVEAKKFVMDNKNKTIQAKRIINFIKNG